MNMIDNFVLFQVDNLSILNCKTESDFSNKAFLNPLDDKTVVADVEPPTNKKAKYQ